MHNPPVPISRLSQICMIMFTHTEREREREISFLKKWVSYTIWNGSLKMFIHVTCNIVWFFFYLCHYMFTICLSFWISLATVCVCREPFINILKISLKISSEEFRTRNVLFTKVIISSGLFFPKIHLNWK